MKPVIGVLLALMSVTNAKAAVIVSKAHLACIELAKQVPTVNMADPNYLSLDDTDSAIAACFFKYAELEKYSYAHCFDVAGALPSLNARKLASQACFDAWFDKGSWENCNWGARQVGRFGQAQGELKTSEQIGKYVPAALTQGNKLGIPQISYSHQALRNRCDEFKRTTLAARIQKEQADLAVKIQNSDRVLTTVIAQDGTQVDRMLPKRLLTETERKVCALEAPLLATNYEILRAKRAEWVSLEVTHLRELLADLPQSTRDVIVNKKFDQLTAALQGVRVSTAYCTLDSFRGMVTFKIPTGYGPNGILPPIIEGEFPLHATVDEDEAQIKKLILDPVPGGWIAYFQAKASKFCPFVDQVPLQAVAGTKQKPADDADIELKLENCNPLTTDCGAGSVY